MSSESILEKPFRRLSPVLDAIKHADYFDALGDAVKRQPFVERWGQHTKPNAFKFLAFEPRQHPYLGKLCKTVKAISRRLEELFGPLRDCPARSIPARGSSPRPFQVWFPTSCPAADFGPAFIGHRARRTGFQSCA